MVRCSPWASCSGLSPRVRGNPSPKRIPPFVVGSIPACAGEPTPSPGNDSGAEVYPRVCGGTGMTIPMRKLCNGLSPRVRGNPYQ